MPLASITIWSGGNSTSQSEPSDAIRSLPSEQHTHPLGKLTTPVSLVAARSSASIPIDPKSLTITPSRRPSGSRSNLLSNVVFPAPR